MLIVFDLGATNTRVALIRQNKIIKTSRFKTPIDFDSGMAALIAAIKRLPPPAAKIKAVIGGTPGPLNQQKTKIVAAPNLPRWNGQPLAQTLRRQLKVPVCLENDADLAALGEAVFGAGKKYRFVAYFTVSTGVGGGRIVDKKIDSGVWGLEPGQQLIGDAILEKLISGAAFTRRYRRSPEQIKDQKPWREAARYLAVGIYNTIVHWSPEVVILGGSMILGAPAISLRETARHLKKINHIYPQLPPLKKAKLGDEAGLYGGIAHRRLLSARPDHH